MVISGKFAFSIEKSQTCELKKPFFFHKSVLFFFCGYLSAEIVVSILPFSSTLVIDNFEDCCTAFEIPESIAETGATHKKIFLSTRQKSRFPNIITKHQAIFSIKNFLPHFSKAFTVLLIVSKDLLLGERIFSSSKVQQQ